MSLDRPPLGSKTGHGVRVAVIDSGVAPDHPHVKSVAGGIGIGRDGRYERDYTDLLGHGTAVAAAVSETAPGARLYAVKVFHRTLSTRTENLMQAIDWATGQGARLINLSLGTRNFERQAMWQSAVDRATRAGALIVAAFEHQGQPCLPGSLGGVAAVVLGAGVPRNELRVTITPNGRALLAASGYPRPIPGVPVERNLQGISFAVANTTGILARVLEGADGIGGVGQLVESLTAISC